MCYDISFTIDIRVLEDYFPNLVFDDQFTIDFSIGAHIQGPGVFAEHAIIYRDREDSLPHCRLHQWGVVPFYVNTKKKLQEFAKGRSKWLNIRSERFLADKNSYWYKIRNRRCLVPVTGIYEHREIDGWKKKVPYYVWLCNERIIFLPGLYSVAEIKDEETGEIQILRTFGFFTRGANAVMKEIHNSGDFKERMPLFLHFDMAKRWINSDLSEAEMQEILDFKMPSSELSYRPTYTIRTSKPREDGKMKFEEYEWAGLPPLQISDVD